MGAVTQVVRGGAGKALRSWLRLRGFGGSAEGGESQKETGPIEGKITQRMYARGQGGHRANFGSARSGRNDEDGRETREGDWNFQERPQSPVLIGWVKVEGGRPSRLLLLLLLVDLHVLRAPCSATLLPACSCSFTSVCFGARASACLDWTEEASITLEGETNALDRGIKDKRREGSKGCPQTPRRLHPHMWMRTDSCTMLRGARQTDSLI